MLQPVSVALQFGFLIVLYLFLVWVTRSALRDLRRTDHGGVVPAGGRLDGGRPVDATGIHTASRAAHAGGAGLDARLVVERAPGHTPGMEYDIGDGAILGRGEQAEIRLEDPFASTRHARLLRQGPVVVIEDMGSTNGTYLNEELLSGPQPLHEGDRVRIGDSEFIYVEGEGP